MPGLALSSGPGGVSDVRPTLAPDVAEHGPFWFEPQYFGRACLARCRGLIGAPIPVQTNPGRVAITPDGTRAWVTNSNDGSVSVIATESTPNLAGSPPAGVLGQPYNHTSLSPDSPRPP